MKISGYEKARQEWYGDILLELNEIQIFCSLQELRKLKSFLEHARKEHSSVEKLEHFHSHYCLWDKEWEWTEDSQDLVIYTAEGPMKISGYEKSKEESISYAIDTGTSLELAEATIVCSLEELRKIESFMEYALEKLSLTREFADSHIRYSLWNKNWSEESSDLVIFTKEEALSN